MNSSPPSTIATRLKSAREAAGYRSARAFAKANDIPYITYSQHEAGKRKIAPDLLIKYAKFLKISPAWLLTGQENEYDDQRTTEIKNNTSGINTSPPPPTNNPKIDANLLGNIFVEVNNLLNTLQISMPDKNKISLCVEVYQKLLSSDTQNTNNSFDILKLIANTITEHRLKKAT